MICLLLITPWQFCSLQTGLVDMFVQRNTKVTTLLLTTEISLELWLTNCDRFTIFVDKYAEDYAPSLDEVIMWAVQQNLP